MIAYFLICCVLLTGWEKDVLTTHPSDIPWFSVISSLHGQLLLVYSFIFILIIIYECCKQNMLYGVSLNDAIFIILM